MPLDITIVAQAKVLDRRDRDNQIELPAKIQLGVKQILANNGEAADDEMDNDAGRAP